MSKSQRRKGKGGESDMRNQFDAIGMRATPVDESREGLGVDFLAGAHVVQVKRHKNHASQMHIFEPIIGGRYRASDWTPRKLAALRRQYKQLEPNDVVCLVSNPDYLPPTITLFLDDYLAILADVAIAYDD